MLCYASGVYVCESELCRKYKVRFEKVIPSCDSWPGFRDWAIGISTCTAAFEALNLESTADSVVEPLTLTHGYAFRNDGGTKLQGAHAFTKVLNRFQSVAGGLVSLIEKNGLNTFQTLEVVHPPCPGQLHEHGFSRTEASPIDVTEVLEVINWFRGCLREVPDPGAGWDAGVGGWTVPPQFSDHRFVEAMIPSVAKASSIVQQSGFCQHRVWEAIRNSLGKELDLPAFVVGLTRYAERLAHIGHDSCTPDFCEFTNLNFTRVSQLHKCSTGHGGDYDYETRSQEPLHEYSVCHQTPTGMFDPALLVERLKAGAESGATAWAIDGRSLVAHDKEYVAISHVWSDGTGVGVWSAGHVNQCLWDFWVDMARRLRCQGIWWDTVCIPQERAARSLAMGCMHMNYVDAKFTLVHDRYLLNIEWTDDEAPCLALVLSPWFTRGWTAVELFLSKRVKVLFRGKGGNGYVIKDLDTDILPNGRFLPSRAQRIASNSIRRLRMELCNVNDLLVALRSRYTSWASDRPIIAGLLCGLTNHSNLSQQDIYKSIVCRLGEMTYTNILHGSPTMNSPGFTWCPANIFDLPTGDTLQTLTISPITGNVFGLWHVLPVSQEDVIGGRFTPYSTHPYVESMVKAALTREYRQCAILLTATDNAKGVLARMIPKKYEGSLAFEFIGCVNVRNWTLEGLRKCAIVICDRGDMVPAEDVTMELARWAALQASDEMMELYRKEMKLMLKSE